MKAFRPNLVQSQVSLSCLLLASNPKNEVALDPVAEDSIHLAVIKDSSRTNACLPGIAISEGRPIYIYKILLCYMEGC